jgi:hypothetical protein
MLIAYLATKKILKKPSNYVYFITYALNAKFLTKRNDSSYVAKSPRNTAPKGGSVNVGRSEYSNICNMCNVKGYTIRNCKLYNYLRLIS